MRILVVNDDGIEAKGIIELAKALKNLGEVIVCAPKYQQSGAGHSLTINKVVKMEKVEFVDGIEAYAVYGTPRDCAELGINGICKGRKIDLLVSGINKGANMSSDVVCSGTCGGACTGLSFKVPSIATSLDFGENYDYANAAQITYRLAEWFVQQPFKYDFTLSINIPNIKDTPIKGYKVCGFGGYHVYSQDLEPVYDGNFIYFDVSTSISSIDDYVENFSGDMYSLKQGYVTLSPLDVDLTRYDMIDKLKCWENN